MVRPALVKRVVQLGINSSKHTRHISSQIPSNAQKPDAAADPVIPQASEAGRSLTDRRMPNTLLYPQRSSFKTLEEAQLALKEAEEDFKRMQKEADEFTAQSQKNMEHANDEFLKTVADFHKEIYRSQKIFSRSAYAMSAVTVLMAGTIIIRGAA